MRQQVQELERVVRGKELQLMLMEDLRTWGETIVSSVKAEAGSLEIRLCPHKPEGTQPALQVRLVFPSCGLPAQLSVLAQICLAGQC